MVIAVISDTHRMNRYIEAAKRYIKDADVLIHLGDNTEDIDSLIEGFEGEVYGVLGNCDFNNNYPRERLIDINGIKIYFTHGDMYGVKYSYNSIFYKGQELSADIVLFGHTHQAFIDSKQKPILMNPGSISLPRIKGRYIGFIEIEEGKEPQIELKEIEV